ncbi:CaiB/BaiF CoA transferase family protein [Actinoallomurus acaciae]|uniref:CaiB/BaiF CoA transferase family protein n=1 Tax=Actinoallomurus acaciae TaxID=502577 RepID=A0ABV5YPF5_9ACTN
MPDQDGPLSGIRVLDLSRFIAGPLCCQMLGDMGADVIKVERPGGEDGRKHRPFYQGHSLYTIAYNRNKRAITLNTRHPEAAHLLGRLIEGSDVVVENFRPGTMAKMGWPYERIRERSPRTVLVSLSGFGQRGPNRDRALFDAIAQAASGLMSVTGRPEDDPTMTGTFVADYVSAFHGVIGTLLALHARTRTGHGQHVDIAALDALMTCLSTQVVNHANLGLPAERSGSRDQITVPANAYPAADGHVYLHGGTDALFPRLCAAMDRPELAGDERFRDQRARWKNVAAADAIVRGWTLTHTCAELGERLGAAGVPYSKVCTVAEAVESEQVAARDMLVEVTHAEAGPLRLPGIPIKLSDTPGSVRLPPPPVGADNDGVYAGLLGLPAEELARLRADGAI